MGAAAAVGLVVRHKGQPSSLGAELASALTGPPHVQRSVLPGPQPTANRRRLAQSRPPRPAPQPALGRASGAALPPPLADAENLIEVYIGHLRLDDGHFTGADGVVVPPSVFVAVDFLEHVTQMTEVVADVSPVFDSTYMYTVQVRGLGHSGSSVVLVFMFGTRDSVACCAVHWSGCTAMRKEKGGGMCKWGVTVLHFLR